MCAWPVPIAWSTGGKTCAPAQRAGCARGGPDGRGARSGKEGVGLPRSLLAQHTLLSLLLQFIKIYHTDGPPCLISDCLCRDDAGHVRCFSPRHYPFSLPLFPLSSSLPNTRGKEKGRKMFLEKKGIEKILDQHGGSM